MGDTGWFVYILRCADGTLYTGVTDNVERRAAEHGGGRGAKYTRGRGPVTVVYREACAGRSAALRREAAVKKLRRAEKLALIGGEATAETEGGETGCSESKKS